MKDEAIELHLLEPVSNLSPVNCPLGTPWHYRRAGVYYLRIRPKGTSKHCATVSLQTRNRQRAVQAIRSVMANLRAFQEGKPEVDWAQLKGQLKVVSNSLRESWLQQDSLLDLPLVGGESVSHHEATILGARLLHARDAHLRGDSGEILDLIRKLKGPSLSVEPVAATSLRGAAVLPLQLLVDAYIEEQKGNVKPTTLHEIRCSCAVLVRELVDEQGETLDLRVHTREDMVRLKNNLLKTRKASTVNKLLTRLNTLMTWAVDNNYLTKTYDKGLKIAQGADSTRKPYSPAQVKLIAEYALGLPVYSWERWALFLGIITGARIGETYQLRKSDVVQVGPLWVVDINDNDGKSLKNKHSNRLIPLVDGAFGFNLKHFLEFVGGCEDRLFTANEHYFSKPLNETLRNILGTEAGGDLTYHSLRHSLASLLKRNAVPLPIAQDILGHSSQAITFDVYGSSAQVAIERMHTAMQEAFLQS
ncbi:tyrosine-type recombinase/integrase [Pseudomonas solani]|uniref:tyrosine-type recombinase/integrase n=1 Tax=Pseudomonas solani TaxID=2731552 RepID=UPI003F4A8654